MTIFGRDHTHLIILCALLPYVTCQQESESIGQNSIIKISAVIGIVLLVMFLLNIVGCCLFYAFHSAETETRGHQVLHTNARRHGIDKSVIESFPSFLYSNVKKLKIGKGGVECAICLNEFEDEETLRWMPPCSHAFHSNCIDSWLTSQSTCPVCRANLSMKHIECSPYPCMDLETGNAQRDVTQMFHDDVNLISNSVTFNGNGNNRMPRSRSTGLSSSWRTAEMFVSRSRSTGHSLVKLGENLDRFTLQLPEEVQRQLVSLNCIRRSRMTLPQARSPREGYRSC